MPGKSIENPPSGVVLSPVRTSLGTLALITDGIGNILLVQTIYDDHHWHLPGGYVEATETPEEALVRELREELGLTIEVMGIRCVAYKAYDSNLSLVYRCRIVSGDPIPDGTEIEAWGYFPLESFPASLSDRTKRIVQAGLTESLNINVITFKKP